MDKQVSVDQLSMGMFVSELDRPWLDTPFLLQGFLIEDEATLGQLRQICRHVTIDIDRSHLDDAVLTALGVSRPKPTAAKAVVMRTVAPPAPVVRQQKAPAEGWFSRFLKGFGQAKGDSAQSGTPPAQPVRASQPPRVIIDQGQPRQVKQSAAPARTRESDQPVQAVRLPRSSSPVSAELLGWLRDSLGKIRLGNATARPNRDDDGPDRASPAERGTTVVRVYQDAVPIEQELGQASESFARATHIFEEAIRDISLGKGLQIEAVESVVNDLVESIIRNPQALQLVSRLRETSESAYTHALQVAVLMVTFGRELGFSRTELGHLGQVGMLLDIGKLRIDPGILNKSGNLTSEEFDEVKRHVEYGLEAIATSASAHMDVVAGVAQHHERLDGSGYPKGMREDTIGSFGQMAGIVDVFSALTSIRPYAEPLSPYEAMRQLQNWGGTYFNAGLVEQFIQAIGIFPVGTLVELSTGEVAVVLEQNRARRLKPKVLVISAPDKTTLKIPVTLDLLYAPAVDGEPPPHIRRGLAAESSGVDAQEYYLSRS